VLQESVSRTVVTNYCRAAGSFVAYPFEKLTGAQKLLSNFSFKSCYILTPGFHE